MSENVCYFGIANNKFSKEEFVRKSYVELYSAIDAPESIHTVQLSDAFVEKAQLLRQYTTYDIDYSVEIGYDHEEQYLDSERYYNAQLKQYLTRQVVKNRTVTNWQPYQGSAKNLTRTATAFFTDGDSIDIGDKDEKISEQYGDYDFDVDKVLQNIEHRQATDEEEKELTAPTEGDYRKMASASASDYAFSHMVSLPGDHYRSFRAEWKAVDMTAGLFAVDRYKLAFDYEGHKCFIKQFATEETPNIYCSYQYVDAVDEEIKNAEQNQLNTDPEFQKNVKIYKTGTLGSLGLGVLSVALSQFLGVVSVVGIVLAIVGFIVSYQFGKKMKAQGEAIQQEYKNKRNEHKTEMQNKKMALLESRFADMGWAPLTDAEKERFAPKNQHKLTDSYYDPSEYEEEEEVEEEPEAEPEPTWDD